jgi:hypothetical protein
MKQPGPEEGHGGLATKKPLPLSVLQPLLPLLQSFSPLPLNVPSLFVSVLACLLCSETQQLLKGLSCHPLP